MTPPTDRDFTWTFTPTVCITRTAAGEFVLTCDWTESLNSTMVAGELPEQNPDTADIEQAILGRAILGQLLSPAEPLGQAVETQTIDPALVALAAEQAGQRLAEHEAFLDRLHQRAAERPTLVPDPPE